MEIISNSYLSIFQQATKTIKDERWKLQTWRHKAVRRAYGDFMLPKGRKIEAFEEIEALNDSVLSQADTSSGKYLTNENEKALLQLGIKLQKFNGVAIASNYQGKENILQQFGFNKNGGNYSIEYIEDAIVIPPKENNQIPSSNDIKPSVKLFSHLSKKMDKKTIGIFVNEVLGLTKDDTDGINEVLADLSLLDMMVDEYMNSEPNLQEDNKSESEKVIDSLF